MSTKQQKARLVCFRIYNKNIKFLYIYLKQIKNYALWGLVKPSSHNVVKKKLFLIIKKFRWYIIKKRRTEKGKYPYLSVCLPSKSTVPYQPFLVLRWQRLKLGLRHFPPVLKVVMILSGDQGLFFVYHRTDIH